MVFYFKVRPEEGDFTIYMGLDKFENEELIKYGLVEDIWSVCYATIYCRMQCSNIERFPLSKLHCLLSS